MLESVCRYKRLPFLCPWCRKRRPVPPVPASPHVPRPDCSVARALSPLSEWGEEEEEEEEEGVIMTDNMWSTACLAGCLRINGGFVFL